MVGGYNRAIDAMQEQSPIHRLSDRVHGRVAPSVGAIEDGARDALGAGRPINGRYRLGARLGRGRLGEIFEAFDLADRDLGVERRKAVQLLSPSVVSDSGFTERLTQAYEALRTGVHPNLVHIFDVGRDGQHQYLVMELLEGASLRTVLDDGVLPLEEALPVIGAVGSALAYLHVKGIVHDNVRPEQVFVTQDYEVKLLDVVPLPLRDTPAEVSDDIFGLACLAYTLLAGRHPYNACSAREAQRAGLKLAPIAALPAGRWAALERGLALSAENRPSSVTEFMLELGLRGAERLRAGPESPQPEARTAPESHVGLAPARPDRALLPFAWTDYATENRWRPRAKSRLTQLSVILLTGAVLLGGAAFLTNETLRSATADLFALAAPGVEDVGNELRVTPPAERELAANPAPGEPPVATDIVESAPAGVAPEPEPPVATNRVESSGELGAQAPPVVASDPEPVAGAEIAVVPPEAPAPAGPEPSAASAAGEAEASLGFAASVVAVPETDPAARVVLERSGDASSSQTVVWWTTDGTALADEDYADLGERTETLGAGEVERTLLVPLIQDTVPEPAAQFFVHVGRYDQRRRHLDLVSSVRVEIRAD
jgi:hypothetical protein